MGLTEREARWIIPTMRWIAIVIGLLAIALMCYDYTIIYDMAKGGFLASFVPTSPYMTPYTFAIILSIAVFRFNRNVALISYVAGFLVTHGMSQYTDQQNRILVYISILLGLGIYPIGKLFTSKQIAKK